ncbi:E22 family MetX-like putative esterase [Falsiroseomonas selenitidurans]|uniref:Probable acyltransferase n=1 Tax=Falsiroseomonas selenitidurans TaxID=2716335 RepID=A0ABX1E7U2_9PROT|nr:homoserine O-acetyltransferase [Falsiroseomonas selenitidurans]NKC33116.1 homoserine O-acetyltransferase [Falsiroseomonas selenitidurans]
MRLLLLALAAAAFWQAAPASHAQPAPAATEIVEKRVFEAPSHTTRNGGTIDNLRIGYQTAGTLNAAGDNAVLVAHFFSGTSHAFGRYAADQPVGYWDAIIGPGRAIDTNRFFVISSDTLVNLNVRDNRTVTTGPASVNPATGRPWGTDFPVVSMRDFIEVQKRLLDSLGVKRLALVTGASMGALQAIEWAAAYPEMIDRVMPVIGSGEVDPWMLAWLDIWEAPIRMDPNWREGDYYAQGREPPLRGLAEALKIVTVQAQDRPSLARFGRRLAEGQDPARRLADRFEAEAALDAAAMARARVSDANHFLYLTRANQLYLNEYASTEAALGRSRARWLVVASPTDRVFMLDYNREMVAALRRLGRPAELVEVTGPLGHLNGVVGMAQVAAPIRAFLAE